MHITISFLSLYYIRRVSDNIFPLSTFPEACQQRRFMMRQGDYRHETDRRLSQIFVSVKPLPTGFHDESDHDIVGPGFNIAIFSDRRPPKAGRHRKLGVSLVATAGRQSVALCSVADTLSNQRIQHQRQRRCRSGPRPFRFGIAVRVLFALRLVSSIHHRSVNPPMTARPSRVRSVEIKKSSVSLFLGSRLMTNRFN
jgi:hypothetical protein